MDLLKKMRLLVWSPFLICSGLIVSVTLLQCAPPIVFSICTHSRILKIIGVSVLDSFAIAYVISLAVSLIKNKVVRRLLSGIIIVCFSLWTVVEIGSITLTGVPITPDSANLLNETNPEEAFGFLKQYFSISFILSICIVALTIILVAGAAGYIRKKKGTFRDGKGATWFASFLMVCIVAAGLFINGRIMNKCSSFSDLQSFISWQGEDEPFFKMSRNYRLGFANPLVKAIYLYKFNSLHNAGFNRWTSLMEDASTSPVDADNARDFDIIIVIGESFIRQHSSLYGYYLDTNPRIFAEADSGRLAIFTDMMTPANFTTTAIRNIFSLNSVSLGESWEDGVYFPLLLSNGGWKVYHYDNQTADSSKDIGISRIFYSPINLRHTYSMVSDSTFQYDGDFLNYINRKYLPKETDGKKMVIYHLSGQHFPAKDRVKGTPRFTAADIRSIAPWLNGEHRQEVADYDNATVYNDSIVAEIINSRKDRPAILFYFSDHGEECWNLAPVTARNLQMPNDSNWLDREFHVPSILWMSDKFSQQYPDLRQSILAVQHSPATLDDLGHYVIGLSGIKTDYYKPQRDIFSPEYTPVARKSVSGYDLEKGIPTPLSEPVLSGH